MPRALSAALAALALLAAGCVTTVANVDLPTNLITVTGTGRVEATPDTALLTLGVESRAATLADAAADAARRMSAVLTRVKAMGIADRDIATVFYNVEPRMAPMDPAHRDEPPRIVGYQVSNIARVTVRDPAQAGPVLDAAVAAGANAVRGIQFTLADTAKAQADARARAVADAIAKARELAAAAALKLGDVVAIRELGVSSPIPMPRAALLRMDATPIESGQLEVVVTVELRQAIQR